MTVAEKKNYLLARDRYDFEDLVLLVEILRSEEGCPWDREQDHQSIRRDFIEETYEVIEAIDTEDSGLLREELGDVLLQVVFHAQIEREQERFDMHDVANDICAKLIHRHPHVFDTIQADTTEQVLRNWERIKSEEKQRVTITDKLRSIPPMLPALMRAEKVGKKAKCFDFSDSWEVLAKMDEELEELKEAIKQGDERGCEEEVGDLLLTVTSLCRKLKIDSEMALNHATEKFINRFDRLERLAKENGLDVEDASSEALNRLWDENKHKSQENDK